MTEEETIRRLLQEYGQKQKAEKVERFRRLNRYCKKGQTVFAGSSLMEQFPIDEFLQDFDEKKTIYNRGVGGFTSQELLDNLSPCILELEPRELVINIGTNDMNTADYSQKRLMENYRSILHAVRETLPEITIWMLAYYPGNPEAAKDPQVSAVLQVRTNARIAEANLAARSLASETGNHWLDLNSGITDEKGCLRSEYTVEGLHMFADGYKQVFDCLLPILDGKNREEICL